MGTVESIIFIVLAALSVISALAVITSRDPVRAVLCLVLTFVLTSGCWIILSAPFLALSLIVVYVGAVMVLFLFVIMMLDIDVAKLSEGFVQYVPLSIITMLVMLGFLGYFLSSKWFAAKYFPAPPALAANYSNVRELAERLFSNYLYPFEVAGAILLVAIIAAISLTFTGPRSRRVQNIAEQIRVSKAGRLKIIKSADFKTNQESVND